MTSLVLRRDLSLEVPKLLIGAVQPYQTLGGPALTTAFVQQPDLLPFQRCAFSHAAVAPLYFHTLLHTLAEFAETPRAVQHSHVRQRHSPKADFWDTVGTLNCFYYSAHSTSSSSSSSNSSSSTRNTRHAGFNGQPFAAMPHPAMGAAELVRPSHRKESDVKLTLFNADHQPIASMLMTGPKATTRVSEDGSYSRGKGQKGGGGVAHAEAHQQQRQHRRTPLPFVAPPTAEADYDFSAKHKVHGNPNASTSSSSSGDSTMDRSYHDSSALNIDAAMAGISSVFIGGTRICGGLYGELVLMPGRTGFAHRAFYWAEDIAATRTDAAAATAASTAPHTLVKAADPSLTEGSETAMPPWVLFDCIQRFFFRLLDEGCLSGTEAATASSPVAMYGWRLCAHHVIHLEDAALGTPLEVVCAEPRVDPNYRLPPWRSQLGLPQCDGGAVPCVSLRCELRQGGGVISTGVYFFCRSP